MVYYIGTELVFQQLVIGVSVYAELTVAVVGIVSQQNMNLFMRIIVR